MASPPRTPSPSPSSTPRPPSPPLPSPPEQAEDASLPEPNTFGALKTTIAKDDFGVLREGDGGPPAPPSAAIKAYKAAGGTVALDRNAPLPSGFYILQAPTENEWAASHRGGVNSLVKVFHAINMMTRVKVTLMGKRSDAVIFRTEKARNLLLVTEIFMDARHDIAAHLTQETLSQFRGATLSANRAQRNWREAQEMLAAAGVLYCPVSGTPVMDLSTATDAAQSAIWEALTAISSALSGKESGVEGALNRLRAAMAAPAEA